MGAVERDEIIRGTTPTIRFTFSKIDTADIEAAYLILRQGLKNIIEKDITSADVQETYIEWELTQAETLKLRFPDKVAVYCDWKLSNGIRGRSKFAEFDVVPSGKGDEI